MEVYANQKKLETKIRYRIKCTGSKASEPPVSSTIQTTLYQLTEAVSEAVPSVDDMVVALIVKDILNHSVLGKVK
jgi:hypothetical protein